MATPDRSPQQLALGARLAEERARIGIRQGEFSKACGVSSRAQHLYECGQRSPNSDYLRAAEVLGVNVHYVLTGTRRASQPTALQVLAGEVLPESVADMVLAVACQKRSEAYRRGLVDVLACHMQEFRSELPFEPGSPEFDAYLAGNERGHLVWTVMVEG